MVSVASCSGSLPDIRKRRNDGEFDDDESPVVKEPRQALYYYVLESESDVPTTEDTESISSIQNKSTDYAKDTSDTSSKASRCSSDLESLAGLEYEVASLSEHDRPFDTCSSGIDSVEYKEKVLVGDGKEEREEGSVWADGSATEPETESRFIPLRMRTCIKCKKAPTNVVQYCQHCYKVRKDFFPPRPKNYKKKSFKPLFRKKRPCPKESSGSWGESAGSSQELTPDFVRAPDSGEGLCNVCLKMPRNGGFLHNKWVHIYACYPCSQKIWTSTKCCPLCNGKIRQVVKVAVG